MAKIVLLQTYTPRETVRQALQELGKHFAEKVRSARTVMLKVQTGIDVDALRGVIDAVQEISRATIYVADAGYYDTRAMFRMAGYETLLSEYANVALVDLHDDGYVDGYTVRADGSRNPIRRSKLAHDVDVRISLAVLASSSSDGPHLAIENWTIGTWLVPPRAGAKGMIWSCAPWLENEGAEGYAASLAALHEQVRCDAAVLCGHAVVAGMDAVAVDAVGATLLGYDPANVGYLTRLTQEGIGTMEMAKIDVPPLLLSQLQIHHSV